LFLGLPLLFYISDPALFDTGEKPMKRTLVYPLVCLIPLSIATAVSAGILNDHPDAYDNDLGPGTGGRWAGTATFSDGNNLSGTIDFAVFTAASFNANFSGLGYTPTDALVYAYQVFSTGVDDIRTERVGVTNDAQDIGQFDIGDVAASAMFLGIDAAEWDFNSPSIESQSSWGLAFSSGNIPEMGMSLTTSLDAIGIASVATPSAIVVP
jgi:hypothetical protein